MFDEQKFNRNNLNYRQSTSAVILDKLGRILIIQKVNYKDNEWDLPGGGIEKDEKPEIAIIRELTEELGSHKFEIIKTSKKVDRYQWPDDEVINRKILENKPVYRGQERVRYLIKFSGEDLDIKPQVEEIREVKWVFLKELPNYFIFPNQMTNMKILLKEFGVI